MSDHPRGDVFAEIDDLEARLARARTEQARLEDRRAWLARRDGWFPSPWQIRLLVVASLLGAMLAWGFGRRHIQPPPAEHRVGFEFPFGARKSKPTPSREACLAGSAADCSALAASSLAGRHELAVRACLLGDRTSCVRLRDALAPLGAPVGILVGQVLCEEHDPSCAPAEGASSVP